MGELKSVTYRLISGPCGGDDITCPSNADFLTVIDVNGDKCKYTKVNYMIAGIILSFMISDDDGMEAMDAIIANISCGLQSGWSTCMVRDIVVKIGGVEI